MEHIKCTVCYRDGTKIEKFIHIPYGADYMAEVSWWVSQLPKPVDRIEVDGREIILPSNYRKH